MAIPMKQNEFNEVLRKMGKRLDSNDQIVELDSEPERPQKDWDTDQLISYVNVAKSADDEIETQIRALGRKQAIPNYRVGNALSLLKEKVRGRYEQLLAEHGITKTWAYLAVVLFQNAPNEEALAGMTLTEARERFCQPQNPKAQYQHDGAATAITPKQSKQKRQKKKNVPPALLIAEPELEEEPIDVPAEADDWFSQIETLRAMAAQTRLIDPEHIRTEDIEEGFQLLDEVEINLSRIREGLTAHAGCDSERATPQWQVLSPT